MQDNSPIAIYIVEGAGCGACVLEAQAALTAHYGTSQEGLVVVEAPAHADVLVLCGPMPSPITGEVERLAHSLHEPWGCVRLGDCATDKVFDREVPVAGCPPTPEEILEAIRAVAQDRGEPDPAADNSSGEEETP
jgi:Ni,Fe-hydrogenase III small subunit